MVWGLWFVVWGLGFGVWGLGFGVWGLEIWGLGFELWGVGFWGFGAWGWGCRYHTLKSLSKGPRSGAAGTFSVQGSEFGVKGTAGFRVQSSGLRFRVRSRV